MSSNVAFETGAVDVTEDLKAAAKAPGTKIPKAEMISLNELPSSIVNIQHAQPSIDAGRINVMLCYAANDMDKMGAPSQVENEQQAQRAARIAKRNHVSLKVRGRRQPRERHRCYAATPLCGCPVCIRFFQNQLYCCIEPTASTVATSKSRQRLLIQGEPLARKPNRRKQSCLILGAFLLNVSFPAPWLTTFVIAIRRLGTIFIPKFIPTPSVVSVVG